MKFFQKWSAKVCDETGKEHVFRASVPGNVQRDFSEYSGTSESLMEKNNAAVLEKTEGYTWTYFTNLSFTREGDERVFFVSEGIDYIFDVELDGKNIFSGEGMYTPLRLDITDNVKEGSLLSVVIHPHPKNGDIVRDRAEAADTCKPPFCYGWDWNPRLLVSGMWMPAYAETVKKTDITSCELFYDLDLNERKAAVRFETESGEKPVYTVFDADGNEVYKGKGSSFELDRVNLWWCSGLGEPYLYRWTAATSTDERSGYVGFRTARLVQSPETVHGPEGGFPKGQYPAPITVELNGIKVFAKGSNLVNLGLFPGAVTEKDCEYIVSSLRDANMNIARVWGGSGIMKKEFYDLCDRYGIMVWQEFMLACNLYSDDRHYLDVLEKEATSIVKALRSHPSLVLWCGGNELFNDWSGMTEQSHAIRLLNAVCYKEDRGRPFLCTSPVSGMAHGGYVFRDDEGHEIFNLFQNSRKTAYTEFGCPSFAPVESLKKIIPENELFPVEDTENWRVHHAFGSWGEKRWVCPDVIEHYFGKQESLEETVEFSQRLQSFGCKACFEEARRQWGYCSMAINWCFNEPWITAANNSLITYPDKRKPAYYAVKDALRPVMASARIPRYSYTAGDKLEFEVWYHNETLNETEDRVTLKIILGDEVLYSSKWETGVLPKMSCRKGLAVSFTLPDHEKKEFLKIVLETDNENCKNEYELLFETYTSHGRMMNT